MTAPRRAGCGGGRRGAARRCRSSRALPGRTTTPCSAVVGAVTAYLEQLPGGSKMVEAGRLEVEAAKCAGYDPNRERQLLLDAFRLRREANDTIEIVREVDQLNKVAAADTADTVFAMRRVRAAEYRAKAHQHIHDPTPPCFALQPEGTPRRAR